MATNEELVEKRVQRYGMAYEGILSKDAIERSKDFWRNELLDLAEEINTAKDAACEERVREAVIEATKVENKRMKNIVTERRNGWADTLAVTAIERQKECDAILNALTPPLPDQLTDKE